MTGYVPLLLRASLNLLVGGTLLLSGRKLFWLFVGAIGFLIGLEVAARLAIRPEILHVVAALAVGGVFAMAGIFLESVAIGMAGFLGGGMAVMRLAALLGFERASVSVPALILGGILGVILIVWLFDWALIVISSLSGASMIAGAVVLSPGIRIVVYSALVILGFLLQSLALRREQAAAGRPSPPA
jgi:hypothetical protein